MDKISILVVDDDATTIKILKETLSSFGYNCRTANDGFEALELIRNEVFSAIICDIRMPGMDGFEVVAAVRKIAPDIPFIVITGFTQEYVYDQIIEAGAADYIEKPIKLGELRIKLNRVLEERLLLKKNSVLLKKANSLNDRLTGLLNMARELSLELDFENLFPLIIKKVTEAMGAERTSLYLIDWNRGEIWTKVAEQFKKIRLPIGQGISGRVAETGDIINVADAWNLSYFDKSFDQDSNFRTRAVLCMPISNRQGERIAVIQVINKIGGLRFGKDDLQVLKALSGFVAIALENSFLIEELEASFEGAIGTLAATVDARHPMTAGHSQRVTEYALAIAREMNLDEDALKEIKYAGLLHDIGKIGIQDSVLLKSGPFTPEERSTMNEHTTKTLAILEKFHFSKKLSRVPIVASYHHEKVNGQGYPFGLTGNELPLASKILAVADVFDALTSRRDYPKYVENETLGFEPMPFQKVIGILKADRGSHFDPEVIDVFFRCMPKILRRYRGKHFPPEYVNGAIAVLKSEI
ncbi:MAG: response regulator [Deltaproteobacteria bacterium]|nr:response regulator [Deltaproteobacteria bacterium]